jgi:hypothetical protein
LKRKKPKSSWIKREKFHQVLGMLKRYEAKILGPLYSLLCTLLPILPDYNSHQKSLLNYDILNGRGEGALCFKMVSCMCKSLQKPQSFL